MDPQTRIEKYLAYIAGEGVKLPDKPITRLENYLDAIAKNGSGGGVTPEEVLKIVTEKVAEIVSDAPEDFDTLKELSDWIAEHEDSAAAMNSAIRANSDNIAELDKSKANAEDLSAVAKSGSYNDLSDKPKLFSGSAADLSGTLSIEKGGTGKTTAKAAQNALLSDMTISESEIYDSTYILMKYAHPDDSTGAIYCRAVPKLWDYIKKKANSVYLPLTGGTLTGTLNADKDVKIPSARAVIEDGTAPYAGALTLAEGQTIEDLKRYKSIIGTAQLYDSTWYNMISIRHRNGAQDGSSYGMYIRSKLTSNGSLLWNKQTNSSTWQGERTILDSENYTSYTIPYGVCSTDADTNAKEVAVSNFSLFTGARVTVKFTNGSILTTPGTLNVNGTGAKRIAVKGDVVDMYFQCKTNQVCDFVYDGTYWNFI